MLRHYLLIGLRLLSKNRLINAINILCLSVGMIVSLTIGSYCSSEYMYDTFNVNVNKIYQLWTTVQIGGEQHLMDRFSAGTASAIQGNFAGVEAAARIVPKSDSRIGRLGDPATIPARLIYTDPDLFNIFTFELLQGNPAGLIALNQAVISESLARNMFGYSTDVLGKTLMYKDTIPLQVVGVIKDVPLRSSLKFDIAVSFATLERMSRFEDTYGGSELKLGQVKIFLLIADKNAARSLPALLPKAKDSFEIKQFHLEALQGAHIRSFGGEKDNGLSVLIAISILILVVVVFNSINITSSLQIKRSNEMVIRKIIGSSKGAVVIQFYVESLLMSFLSLTIALAGAYMTMEPISRLLAITVDFSYLLIYPFPIIAGVVFAMIVLAGGLYPALVLSNSNPSSSISGGFERSVFARYSRRVSLFFQFTASFILVIAAFLLSDQLKYSRGAASEVDLDEIMVVQLGPKQGKSYQAIRKQLLSIPNVTEIAATNVCLFQEPNQVVVTSQDTTNQIALHLMTADLNFIHLMKLNMVMDTISSSALLVNEVARKALYGLRNPIGRPVLVGPYSLTIRGTIRDFHYQGIKNKIGNLGLTVVNDTTRAFGFTGCAMYIRFTSPGDMTSHAPQVLEQLSNVFPEEIWEYTSLSDVYNRSTASENNIFDALSFLSVLSIIIAAFGIVGQLLFQIQSKTAEISVRKVLGANWLHIGRSICSDMLIILIISISVSIPIALTIVSEWIASFAYKTTVSVLSIFMGVAVITSMVVMIMTIFVRRAYLLKVTEHLRNE